ncbi:MAG: hypothetical protein ABIF82_00565 [Planctomycetota bacterium]
MILLASSYYLFYVHGGVLDLWPLWVAIPPVMGVAGIFFFDKVVAVYDRYHKDYTDGR